MGLVGLVSAPSGKQMMMQLGAPGLTLINPNANTINPNANPNQHG